MEFNLDKSEQSAVFDEKGKLIETEIEIEITELPLNTFNYVQKNHPGQKIKEAAKITDVKGKVTYEAEIKGRDLIVDNKGDFIREIKHKK